MDDGLKIGTAGWSVSSARAEAFPRDGTGLERYAAVLPATEVNTTFYRPHRPTTFERWARATPPSFRFALKAPQTVTHEHRLVGTEDLLAAFFHQIGHLGDKLGPVLIQLPPSLVYSEDAARFIGRWRALYTGPTVIEPRHATWFTDEVEARLAEAEIARVGADPAVVPAAAQPGGWRGLTYLRLHGSPQMYASAYQPPEIAAAAETLARRPARTQGWCIFDNTMYGAATANALEMLARG